MFLCEAIVLLRLIIYCWLVSPSLFSLSLTLIYTQISDESPSSHHHSGTQKTCSTLTHTQTHTSTVLQCAHRYSAWVQEKIKTYSTNSSVVKNNTTCHFLPGKDQQQHSQFVLKPRKHDRNKSLFTSRLFPLTMMR